MHATAAPGQLIIVNEGASSPTSALSVVHSERHVNYTRFRHWPYRKAIAPSTQASIEAPGVLGVHDGNGFEAVTSGSYDVDLRELQ
jgi:hypothetical protein